MRILIIGGGSIGQRHLRNLRALGVKNIAVLDIQQARRKEIEKKYRVETRADLTEALKEKWDAFFICVPPSKNIAIAIKCLEKKATLFIEKPLSDSLKGVPELIKKAREKKSVVMIGYNLNFHPQIKEIKIILDKGLLGKIYGARVDYGHYLPDWHPSEDYRRGYSAQRKMGGGIILDDIHEIDYLYFLFGKPEKLFAFAGKVSNLGINTEDYAEATIWFKNGIIGQLHMDYLQRAPSRTLKIIGEKGTLTWDIRNNELKYFLAGTQKWEIKRIKNFDYNLLYIEELKHFLKCVATRKTPETDILRGIISLKIALGIKQSSKQKKIIKL